MTPIAVFYHCLFWGGNPLNLLPAAIPIIQSQMQALEYDGLLASLSHFCVGINGSNESRKMADQYFPINAHKVFHGLQCKNENRTILELEKWLPLHEDWYVLYHHSKGASHAFGDIVTDTWRKCMTRHCVSHWRQCVSDLKSGYDAVGVHWMQPPATPKGQFFFAGTFWWGRASYLLTLPSIRDQKRVKESGMDAYESRYEAEIWIGNGRVKPRIKDYHGPKWSPSKWQTCKNETNFIQHQ